MAEIIEKKSSEEKGDFNGFVEAMKTKADSESGLKEAFHCLTQGRSTGPVTTGVLCQTMENRGVSLTDEKVTEIVGQVKPEWKNGEPISYEEFNNIFKELEKCNVEGQLKNIYDVVTKGEHQKIVLYGDLGVGKTWMAKKVADRAVRRGVFKYAIWIYPKRTYQEGITLHESIAHQLFLILDFYKSEAEAAKRGAEEEEEKAKHGAKETLKKKEKLEPEAEAPKHGAKEQEGKRNDRADEETMEKKELEPIAHAEAAKHGVKEQGKKHVDKVDEETRRKNKLEKMIRGAVEEKKLLLIIDDEAETMEPLLPKLWNILGLKEEQQKKYCTRLITRRSKQMPSPKDPNGEKVIGVMPWTRSDAKLMFKTDEDKKTLVDAEQVEKKFAGDEQFKKELADVEEVKKKLADADDEEAKRKLADAEEVKKKLDDADFFIERTRRYPAEILIIVKSLKYLWGKGKEGLQEMQTIKKEMDEEKDCNKVIQRLITAYDPIPKSILIDCYSKAYDNHFLHKGRCMVNFNELICYWIMEGYFGEFVYFQDAYNEGYRVVMDLLDCGLLRKLEDSYVMWSGLKFDFEIQEYYDFYRDVRLGMGDTFDSKLGRIALADGIMRTVAFRQEEDRLQASEKPSGGEKMQTLMLDGNHFGIPDNSFFKESVGELASKGFLEPELEILAVFNPTIKPFPLPADKLKKLRLLVLRGCRYLDRFSEGKPEMKKPDDLADKSGINCRALFSSSVFSLGDLTVLEISGLSNLDEFPNFFFKETPGLRSVNLSSSSITRLPESFYELREVEYLILRDCCKLEVLESLENFTKLQLIDASGSTKLRSFKQKNFVANEKLQFINFSRTFIDRIPLVRSLQKLISLTVSDCHDLRGIRKINGLKALRVLDISGSKKVEEFLDPTIDDLERIEILDISRTSMRRLPGNMGDPRVLLIRDCLKLKDLLPINSLSKVEVFDISGCCKVEEIKDDFMKNLKCLRELNLSRTGIASLPRLPDPLSLRKLLLTGCESLKKLDGLNSMKKLEELDLSGLQVNELPSLSELVELKTLCIRDCPNLTSLPGIEKLRVLKKVDHSGTTLESSLSFEDGCHPAVIGPIASSLNGFDLKTLLEDLGATDYQDARGDDSGKKSLTDEEGKKCNWKISSWPEEANNSQKAPADGLRFLQLWKERPLLFKNCFTEFHLQIVPMDLRIQLPDESSYRDELKLRRLYFKQVSTEDMPQGCLEIRGFTKSPESAKCLLSKANSVVLVDNPFFTSLFKLGPAGVNALGTTSSERRTPTEKPSPQWPMKVCWIERCNEMKFLIQPGEAGDQGNVFTESFWNLQVLWLSHVMKLEKISNDDIPGFSFQNLKTLYLEFCPELKSICSSINLLKSLESLHIRHCKNLVTLFDDTSAKHEKLTKLHFWGLPKLEATKLEAPSLENLRVGDCHLLTHALASIPEGYGKLDTLRIKLCDGLKTICEPSNEDLLSDLPNVRVLELWALPKLQGVLRSVESLETMKVGECDSLEKLVVADEFPRKLKEVEVKCCEKLKMVFDVEGMEEMDVRLARMELMCLPELKTVPHLKADYKKTWGCPKAGS